MQWFLIFGIIGFVELVIIGLPIMALINKSKGRGLTVGFKQASTFAVIASFIYSGFIFIGEGEASTIAAPNESFLDTLRFGLPIYLVVFSFYVLIPASLYIMLWSDKMNKKQTRLVTRSINSRKVKSKTIPKSYK